MNKKRLIITVLTTGLMVSSLTGCVKPYQTPMYEEIGTSESAFLIPLLGNTSEQASFESEELLEKNKVATKRVEIPTEWIQLKRHYWQGEWKPTMKLIKVDRTAVSREWTEGEGDNKQNQGIVGSSKESIGFMSRMACTASIQESDVSKFLYNYNTKTLADIMDNEIRTTVESKFNEECSKRTMNEIFEQKEEIMNSVREHTANIFVQKGITISNLGFKGEFTPLDSKIQESINAKFTAQQQAEAQAIVNKKNEDQAESQAKVINSQASTLEQSIKLKEVEVEKIKAEAELKKAESMGKWNVEIIGDTSVIRDNREK